ncbi:MAG: DUF374 domain-containing protein, partial [Rhodospirillales bacterium]|nr:DUF374 domain-containing protein [Rhodospirillales bacterium]
MRRPGAQALLASLVGWYLDFALRHTRWTLHGAEHMAPHVAGAPVVVAFWHERLPLMPVLWRLARAQGTAQQVHVLVSRHKDGRFIGTIMRRFGLAVVHGSTTRDGRDRGGAASVRALLDVLEAGGV